MKPRALSEKAIQTAVVDRWRQLGKPGTLVAAIPNARAFGQPGLTRGLFDLIVIGGNVGQGWIELKAERGRLSPRQQWFRDVLDHNGIPRAVTYGLDQAVVTLEVWGIIRTESLAANPKSRHAAGCAWQLDQYSAECTCGVIKNPLAAGRPGRAGDGEAAQPASPDLEIKSPSRARVEA